MASQDQPASTAVDKTDTAERDFARRAAAAELDAQRIEDERRAALTESEAVNYERALGAPTVKGE